MVDGHVLGELLRVAEDAAAVRGEVAVERADVVVEEALDGALAASLIDELVDSTVQHCQ